MSHTSRLPVVVILASLLSWQVLAIGSGDLTSISKSVTRRETEPAPILLNVPPIPSEQAFQFLLPGNMTDASGTDGHASSFALAGRLGGFTTAVALHNNYAYTGVGSDLVILNITNPRIPTVSGRTSIEPRIGPSFVNNVAVSGNYAYIADRNEGLHIVSVANPAAPVQFSFYDTPGAALDVKVAGSYAYVTDGYFWDGRPHVDGSLRVINVSDPANPRELGSYGTAGEMWGMALTGGYAYVASGWAGLRIINVVNPNLPTPVGSYRTPGYAWDVVIAGDYAFVAQTGIWNGTESVGSGLRIINIANPNYPREVGFCSWNGSATGVTVSGHYAYVASGTDGFRIIDIQNPTAPSQIGSYDTPGGASDVVVSGNYAYVPDYSGLRIIGITDPASPTQVGVYNMLGGAGGIVKSGNYAYVADSTGLRIVDMSNPMNPVQIGFIDTPGQARQVSVVGTYAYVADYDRGLRIINVANPASPVFIGCYDTPGYAEDVVVTVNTAYVADGSSGLRTIDISHPASPTQVGYYDTPGWAYGVALAGSLAYVADYDGGVRIINISNPAFLTEVGSFDTPGYAMGVSVVGNHAYVADAPVWNGVQYNGGGLRIFDVSNPAAPAQVGFFDTPGFPRNVAVQGNYAYVADSEGGTRIINVANPLAPAEVGFYNVSGGAEDVAVAGNYAYVADWTDGLVILYYTGDLAGPAPFLDLPFDYSGSSFSDESRDTQIGQGGKVNAYFDHEYPTMCSLPNMGGCDATDTRAVNFYGYDGTQTNPPPYNVVYNGHNGIDFRLAQGTLVLAAASGTVSFVGGISQRCADGSSKTANVIKVTHDNGYVTEYWHLSSFASGTSVGSKVTRDLSHPIGYVGSTGCSTGPHLHLLVRNPSGVQVDPYGWKTRPGAKWYSRPDPWRQYEADNDGLDAISYYLWTEPLLATEFVSPSSGTRIVSTSGQVTALIPAGAYSAPLRIELAEALQSAVIPGYRSLRTFSMFGFTANEVPVTALDTGVALDVFVSTTGNVQSLATDSTSTPKIRIWDSQSSSWQELPTVWDQSTGHATAISSHIGAFVLTVREEHKSFLPLLLKRINQSLSES